MKVARSVWSGGKSGDNIKGLPIAINFSSGSGTVSSITTQNQDPIRITLSAEKIGIVEDSIVSGISYSVIAPTGERINGITDKNGQFKYFTADDNVSFYLNNSVLGKVTVKERITPLDLIGTTDLNDSRVGNLLVLFQSLDSDSDPDNGITIVEENVTSQNLNLTSLDSVKSVINGSNKTVISLEEAQKHFSQTQEMFKAVKTTLAENNLSVSDINNIAEIIPLASGSTDCLNGGEKRLVGKDINNDGIMDFITSQKIVCSDGSEANNSIDQIYETNDSLSWSNGAKKCKFLDMRLPTVVELETFGKNSNSSGEYWSRDEINPSLAYQVNLSNGFTLPMQKNNRKNIVCTGYSSDKVSDFSDSETSWTVVDVNISDRQMSWNSAVRYCDSINMKLPSFGDFRNLANLHNYSNGMFWSSVEADATGWAYLYRFDDQFEQIMQKQNTHPVLCIEKEKEVLAEVNSTNTAITSQVVFSNELCKMSELKSTVMCNADKNILTYGYRPLTKASWDEAKKYCSNIGMKLPTLSEIFTVQRTLGLSSGMFWTDNVINDQWAYLYRFDDDFQQTMQKVNKHEFFCVQFEKFDETTEEFKKDPKPFEQMTWWDAKQYCSDGGMKLPTFSEMITTGVELNVTKGMFWADESIDNDWAYLYRFDDKFQQTMQKWNKHKVLCKAISQDTNDSSKMSPKYGGSIDVNESSAILPEFVSLGLSFNESSNICQAKNKVLVSNSEFQLLKTNANYLTLIRNPWLRDSNETTTSNSNQAICIKYVPAKAFQGVPLNVVEQFYQTLITNSSETNQTTLE